MIERGSLQYAALWFPSELPSRLEADGALPPPGWHHGHGRADEAGGGSDHQRAVHIVTLSPPVAAQTHMPEPSCPYRLEERRVRRMNSYACR